MRIGLLTFHKPINYGAFLQAFSFSDRLKKELPEHDIEIIDYIAPKEFRQIYINILRDFKHGGLSAGIKSIKKRQMFKKHLKYLPLSDKSFCTENLEKFFSYIKEHYDCLLIGSDAVFNWNQNGFPTAFIPNYDFGIPVFTYAASVHGLKYYDVEKEKIDICKRALEKISFVGVRDECTAKFVRYCCPAVSPAFCCDPTLFIDCEKLAVIAGDYTSRIEKKYKISLDRKYIVFMAPDSELLKSVAMKYRSDYTIISLFKKSKYSDVFLYDCNPFEWAMLLRNASATITSYFHGTLLSLVQGTPAVVLDYSGYDDRYEGKLNDLINRRFDLSELYFDKKYAQMFCGQEEFYALFDKILNGEYLKKITDGVEIQKKSFDNFLTCLKESLGR